MTSSPHSIATSSTTADPTSDRIASSKPISAIDVSPNAATTTTVVLVHGAFVDGSSWRKVIPLLQAAGLKVVAVQNPLTSLAEDVAFTRRAIAAQNGPVVLVGHSWGGSVITQVGDHEKVRALVYVAAFAPAAGESSVDLIKTFPPTPGKEGRITTEDGFQTLSPDAVRDHFAQDLGAEDINLIAVTQGAVRIASFSEKLTIAAWTGKPSWYIVSANDCMIHPDAQRALAKRAKATTVTLKTSHVPMLSQPEQVAEVIIAAAHDIQRLRPEALPRGTDGVPTETAA